MGARQALAPSLWALGKLSRPSPWALGKLSRPSPWALGKLSRRRNGDDVTSTMSPTSVSTVDSAPVRSALRTRVGGSVQQLLAFVSLIVIMVFFTIASPYFLTPSNLIGILMA